VRSTVRTGIEYQSLIPGLVPEYEEREAARFGHYTWRDWLSLPYLDRVVGVAHYRMFHLIELHHNDAVITEQERRERQARASQG